MSLHVVHICGVCSLSGEKNRRRETKKKHQREREQTKKREPKQKKQHHVKANKKLIQTIILTY